MLDAWDELDEQNGRTNYVLLYDWRRRVGLPRQEFDNGLRQLRIRRIISLDAADGRHEKLSAAQTQAGLMEEGRLLSYAKRRGYRGHWR
jgi:hypothetical protein